MMLKNGYNLDIDKMPFSWKGCHGWYKRQKFLFSSSIALLTHPDNTKTSPEIKLFSPLLKNFFPFPRTNFVSRHPHYFWLPPFILQRSFPPSFKTTRFGIEVSFFLVFFCVLLSRQLPICLCKEAFTRVTAAIDMKKKENFESSWKNLADCVCVFLRFPPGTWISLSAGFHHIPPWSDREMEEFSYSAFYIPAPYMYRVIWLVRKENVFALTVLARESNSSYTAPELTVSYFITLDPWSTRPTLELFRSLNSRKKTIGSHPADRGHAL